MQKLQVQDRSLNRPRPDTLESISLLGLPAPNYREVWELQKLRVDEIAAGKSAECLIFCEHEIIATKGRRAKDENLLDTSIPTIDVERGGDISLHQPGQLVIYPLLKLHGLVFKGGLGEYLRFCEEVIIKFLASKGFEAGRFGPTGVWIRTKQNEIRKIASIGIAVRKWVTFHGIALNINNDLSVFNKIRPCDFDASVMTSMSREGVECSLSAAATEIEKIFQSKLGRG